MHLLHDDRSPYLPAEEDNFEYFSWERHYLTRDKNKVVYVRPEGAIYREFEAHDRARQIFAKYKRIIKHMSGCYKCGKTEGLHTVYYPLSDEPMKACDDCKLDNQ